MYKEPMSDLFSQALPEDLIPLSEKVRPRSISEIVGQSHFLSNRSAIAGLLKNKQLVNLILWGPPGTGKTTLAKNLAQQSDAYWIEMNAVDSGVKDLKIAGEKGKNLRYEQHRKTLLFVDEIHRFNKSQQDVLLPYIERGDLYLIGATTENPSYELNRALLSRCQVIEFRRLDLDSLNQILKRTFEVMEIPLSKVLQSEAAEVLLKFSDGDSRRLLNSLEVIIKTYKSDRENLIFPLNSEALEDFVGKKFLAYDKNSQHHYDTISAFIKSMRGSDPDAALYYCARMLEGGEDPTFIARRMIIFASEDVGNADPRALPLAVACLQAVEAIGMPECRINLGQTICFLAAAPKSNRSYVAINRAIDFVRRTGSASVPEILRSTPKSREYQYPHDFEKAYVKQNYWPKEITPEKFYEPIRRGQEKALAEYLAWVRDEKPPDEKA
jgi:putative ATPase